MKLSDEGHEDAGRPVRVGWYFRLVPHYRVGPINRLAEEHGIELTVFAGQAKEHVTPPDAAGDVVAPIVRLHNLFGARREYPLAYAHGWTRMLRSGLDVLIVSEQSRDIVTWLVLGLRRWFGVKLIVTGHIRAARTDLRQLDGRLAGWLRRLLTTSADGVIAYTSSGVAQALAWGCDPSSVVAMQNTIDVKRIKSARRSVSDEALARLRDDLRLSRPVMLFIGRPTDWKRLDVAIEATRHLVQRGLPAHLIVVGSGTELPAYRERAQSMASVHFVGGLTREEDLAPYFAASDFVLIPGAVGLAANHAFAYGLPLVTSKDALHGPEMELARNDENVVMVDTFDPVAFAKAIEEIIRAPGRPALLR